MMVFPKRYITLFLGFFLGLSAIALTVIPPFSSTAQTPVTKVSPDWSGMVVDTENSWLTQYETYFDSDFTNRKLTGDQIAQFLQPFQTKTGTRPAVIWAKNTPQGLVVILSMPGQKTYGYFLDHPTVKALNPTILGFLNALKNPQSQHYLDLGKQLYDWLIFPLEPHLKANQIDTLILCLGEGLRSLPFTALYDGKKFLVEKYALARVPAFNLTELSTGNLRNARVLAMGASEFSQQQPLPGVAIELQTILQTPWQGVSVLNQGFTVKNLKAWRQREDFQIVHLATHADFLPGEPSQSYIQFSDQRLTLKQLKELGLNQPPVELLVLSACQTAVGNKEVELGFSGLALQAGVKSAIASFWPVSDAGTLALMSEFYQRLKGVVSKAEALRQAQVAMIRGKVYLQAGELVGSRGTVTVPESLGQDGARSLAHPYYWAGFSLIGSPW